MKTPEFSLIPPKVLLCDDENLECEALRHIFSHSPIPVTISGVAHNGLAAIRLVEEQQPQIVFIDIRMPGMDGLEATQKILSLNPEIQVVVLSAYSDFAYAQEALRLGILDYILKPAEPEILYEVLGKAVQRLEAIQARHQRQKKLEKKLALVLPQLEPLDEADDYDPIKNAIVFIRKNFQDDLRLDQVAKAVSLSPAYFSRLFQKRTGSNFRDYLLWLRMEAAKILLKESNLPIAGVSESVGYHDSNHFSVRFKKETGLTPNQYRRKDGGERPNNLSLTPSSFEIKNSQNSQEDLIK
jgi:YesN/AraC family two-component response regulator